jgi:hypothetical protein
MTNTKLLRSRVNQKVQARFWSRVGQSDLPGLGNKFQAVLERVEKNE